MIVPEPLMQLPGPLLVPTTNGSGAVHNAVNSDHESRITSLEQRVSKLEVSGASAASSTSRVTQPPSMARSSVSSARTAGNDSSSGGEQQVVRCPLGW